MTWSTSFPGTVTQACGDVDGAFEVHRETGRMLRIGSEAYLCFDCAPDGGVYHPDDRDGQPNTLESVRAIAARFDRHFNRFVVHDHHTFVDGHDGPTIQHAHTDGGDAHRHPETATAWYGHQGERREKPVAAPVGDERPYVELTDEERTFRVVLRYVYINPGQNAGSVRVGRPLTARERKALKPPPEWTRAEWRRSMDVTVAAIRLQQYGEDVQIRGAGAGAIDMTAIRMADNFGLEARYEIEGWTPTPYLGLP